eukprot:TRINITY_DN20752_c0_g1_i1.p1 TRINITY_DN20752_c0_g1~~TRINITY_DN20752_c0_g1_i1.p1  ORF type:complete len:267 (-),score=54.61 TRINITY_DN20752_c0_g1_i1:189-989(-)
MCIRDRSTGDDTHDSMGWRELAFPKKSGAMLEKAMPFTNEVYEGYYPCAPAAPPFRTNRSVRAGKLFYFQLHTWPDEGYYTSLSIQLVLLGFWLCFYPLHWKLRSFVIACVYSLIESCFTLLERGSCYTSGAQFWGNLLYVPVLLDGYGWLLQDMSPALYVVLFPVNVWILEMVMELVFRQVYGRNVAWSYLDYSDEYLEGCIRVGHAIPWLAVGMACLFLDPVLTDWVNGLLETSLWDVCTILHQFFSGIGLSSNGFNPIGPSVL